MSNIARASAALLVVLASTGCALDQQAGMAAYRSGAVGGAVGAAVGLINGNFFNNAATGAAAGAAGGFVYDQVTRQ